jgi:hypothetical protein
VLQKSRTKPLKPTIICKEPRPHLQTPPLTAGHQPLMSNRVVSLHPSTNHVVLLSLGLILMHTTPLLTLFYLAFHFYSCLQSFPPFLSSLNCRSSSLFISSSLPPSPTGLWELCFLFQAFWIMGALRPLVLPTQHHMMIAQTFALHPVGLRIFQPQTNNYSNSYQNFH